jgi:hypothetical protein
MDAYRANVGRIHNRAIFEIPQILEQILQTDGPRQWSRSAPRSLATVH